MAMSNENIWFVSFFLSVDIYYLLESQCTYFC
jgi:hypothetical protein